MKDFDQARRARESADRRFVIAGQEFTYKAAVAPETLLEWNAAATRTVDLDEAQWLNLMDRVVLLVLEDGQEEKWRAVREPGAAHPLNINDLTEVMNYLITEATARPTGEPIGSSNGSATTETASREESSAPAEASTA